MKKHIAFLLRLALLSAVASFFLCPSYAQQATSPNLFGLQLNMKRSQALDAAKSKGFRLIKPIHSLSVGEVLLYSKQDRRGALEFSSDGADPSLRAIQLLFKHASPQTFLALLTRFDNLGTLTESGEGYFIHKAAGWTSTISYVLERGEIVDGVEVEQYTVDLYFQSQDIPKETKWLGTWPPSEGMAQEVPRAQPNAVSPAPTSIATEAPSVGAPSKLQLNVVFDPSLRQPSPDVDSVVTPSFEEVPDISAEKSAMVVQPLRGQPADAVASELGLPLTPVAGAKPKKKLIFEIRSRADASDKSPTVKPTRSPGERDLDAPLSW